MAGEGGSRGEPEGLSPSLAAVVRGADRVAWRWEFPGEMVWVQAIAQLAGESLESIADVE